MSFEAIKEELRQGVLKGQDSYFLLDMVYYFELRVPSSVSEKTTFLFPLILGPENITLEEPFAIAEAEVQGSGLFVDENGILKRNLRITGHTGWQPRKFKGSTGLSAIRAPESGRSHARTILDPIADLSGQKHFHFLQDAVFRTYGDLKRDPSTSKGTSLRFHMPREGEHWEVKPRKFTLTRSLDKRNLYQYDMDLLIVGVADDPGKGFSEDQGVLDAIKDGIRMVQSGIDLVRGAVQDVTAFVNDIERTIKGVGAVINDAIALVDDAADFVSGVSSAIAAPYQAVSSVVTQLDQVLQKMDESVRQFPDPIRNAFRQIQVGMDRIGSFPEHFQTTSQRALELARKGESLSSSKGIEALRAAADAAPPNSFQQLLALGTASMPGDLIKARSELEINKALVAYQSAREYALGGGDTLQSLAAKFLGDARLWRHIAALNNMEPPFISREGLPRTKRVGDKILIPSKDQAPTTRSVTPVLGVPPEASAEERVLGTDLMLDRQGTQDLFDLMIDSEGGSVDLKLVRGVDNLKQGLLSRLRTERGTDTLYQEVGMDRVTGLPIPSLGAQVVAIRVGQAVRADPRIAAIHALDIEQPQPDAIVINLDAEVLGIGGTQPISLHL